MRIAEMIAALSRAGGYFEVLDGDRLGFVGPKDLLTDEIRAMVAKRRTAIVAWLRTPIDQQPKEDQLLFDYNPIYPPGYMEDARWFPARLLWPEGAPAASPEPSPAEAKPEGRPATGGAHRRGAKVNADTKERQGELWK